MLYFVYCVYILYFDYLFTIFFFFFFFFNDTATTEIYTLSLHDALPIQLQRSTWGEAHPQPLLSTPASCITPAHHRTCIAADAPPNLIERVTRIQQRQGSPAPVFEQVGASSQSGHRCSPPEHLLLHYLCRSLLGPTRIR